MSEWLFLAVIWGSFGALGVYREVTTYSYDAAEKWYWPHDEPIYLWVMAIVFGPFFLLMTAIPHGR